MHIILGEMRIGMRGNKKECITFKVVKERDKEKKGHPKETATDK